MNLFESIADRRIGEARRAGYFDNLPGKGKPIADLDRQRPAGWWGTRIVRTERDKLRHETLVEDLRRAMPPLWRLETEAEVMAEVDRLNTLIGSHNAATTFRTIAPLSPADTVGRWRSVRAARAGTGPDPTSR